MSNEVIGHGVVIGYGDGGTPESYTDFAQITDVEDLDINRDEAEITNHDATDYWRRFIGALIDGGEVRCTLTFQSSEFSTMLAMIDDANQNFRVSIPDASTADSTAVFNGFMKTIGLSFPTNEAISIRASFRVSGPVTFTAGT